VVYQIKDLNHVLLFSFGVSRDSADIVKIQSPFHTRSWSFFRLRDTGQRVMDTLMFMEDLPNGAGGTR
jgi:hypothetical protein